MTWTWVDSALPLERQAAQLKDYRSVIAMVPAFPVELAQACPNLRLVQVRRAGTEHMDIQGLGELGIKVANDGGGNAVAVAEHTVALMLSICRKLKLQLKSVQARQWAGGISARWLPQSHDLPGKTVGIIGLGHIGQQLARRLQGWDCNLIYDDAMNRPAEVEEGVPGHQGPQRRALDDLRRGHSTCPPDESHQGND